jgi:hypothetical protein
VKRVAVVVTPRACGYTFASVRQVCVGAAVPSVIRVAWLRAIAVAVALAGGGCSLWLDWDRRGLRADGGDAAGLDACMGADLARDPENCGRCGARCPGTTCASGTCTNVCRLGWLDCNGNVVDGCEVDASSDVGNCGACRVACAPGQRCAAGVCTCPAGTANCDGDPTNGCEAELARDAENCGACGRACGPNEQCGAAACGCAPGFADCDGALDTGCETATARDRANCGACGQRCEPGFACVDGACGCEAGRADCDRRPANACEVDTNSSAANCGACGHACGERERCVDGRCACDPQWGDCDGDPANGCETALNSPANCGEIGRAHV